MTSLQESFEKRRDECLGACEKWYSEEHDPMEFLQHRVNDPVKAYWNKVGRFEVWKFLDKIKTWIYSYIGAELWENPQFHELYRWLGGYWGHEVWHLKMEYSGVSPEQLKEIGFQDGDELWHWSTPEFTWEYLFGRAGYCVIRNKKIIWSIVTELN